MTFRYWIDVDDDNQFSGTDEITADVLSAQWRIGLRNSLARLADETQATLVVNNTDGKYAPENPSSPLYGKLHPQKRLRITHDDLPLWTGWLSMPQVGYMASGDASGKTTVTLNAVGGKALLEELPARLPLYSDVTAEQVLTEIFSTTLLPPAVADVWRLGDVAMSFLDETTRLGSIADFAEFDNGKFRFQIFGDVAYDDLWSAIHHLVVAERGHFFFRRDGRAVFWHRHRLHLPYTPIAEVTSDNEYAPQAVVYRYGERLINEAWVECSPRQAQGEAVLWALDSPLTLAPNQHITLEARLRRAGGQSVGADDTLYAIADFTQGNASIRITPLGGKALINITNTNRTSILNSLTLNGKSNARQNTLAVIAKDSDSQAQYGRYGTKIRIPAPANPLEIQSIAQYEVLAGAHPSGVVERLRYIQSAIATHPQQLAWTVGSVLEIDLPELYHHADYVIIGEQHRIEATVQTSEYILAKMPMRLWVLGETDEASLGNLSKLGY